MFNEQQGEKGTKKGEASALPLYDLFYIKLSC